MATFVRKQLDGKVRWQAIVRRRGHKSQKKTFDLRGQAEAWAREIEREVGWSEALGTGGAPGMPGTPGAKLTFEALAKRYLDAGLGRESRVRFWIKALGEKPLPSITSQDIQKALDAYSAAPAEVFIGGGRTRARKGGEAKRGPASRNRLRSTAASIFRWARGQQLFASNPVHDVAPAKEPAGRVRFLSDEEEVRLRAAAQEPGRWPKLHLLVSMALATGARASELTEKVTWERIDWRERTVQIDTSKNGDPRVLVLTVPVIEELMRHRPVDAKGKVIDKPSGLVFGRPYDPKKPISPRNDPNKPFTVRKHWVAAVKDAGIANFRFHDTRHTCASWLVSAGVPLYNVGQVLGHRSPQSTARYAHLSIAAKKEAVDRVMGARLQPAKN